MHDVPYIQNKSFGPEIVASMSVIAAEMRRIVPKEFPLGIQVCIRSYIRRFRKLASQLQ